MLGIVSISRLARRSLAAVMRRDKHRFMSIPPMWLLALALFIPACHNGGHDLVSDELSAKQAAQARATFVRALPDTEESARLLAPPDSVVMRSGLVVLQPSANCGWHSTDDYEEMIICLEGNGAVLSEDQAPRSLAAGQYAYNPPRTRHNVSNVGQERMRYIYVVSKTPMKAD